MPPRKRTTVEDTTLPDDHPTPTDDLDGPPVAPDTGSAPDGPHIGTTQMRQLHALLRDHGITTDTAVHDYLSLHLGREVTSRRTITAKEAGHLIADLEAAPIHQPVNKALIALREPFTDEAIGRLPRSLCSDCSRNRGTCERHPTKATCQVCGNYHNTQATMHIDFVGHADVTDRLLSVDPSWTWEPMAQDAAGLPVLDRAGGLWIRLTVLGITRPGYGDSENGKGVKEAIGDALRNAAMRFGVALDLWAKGDRQWAHTEKSGTDQHPDSHPGNAPQQDPPRPTPPPQQTLTAEDWTTDPDALALTAGLITDLERFAEQTGTTLAGITAKWREHHGNVSVDRLVNLAPMTLAPLVDSIAAYLEQNPPLTGDTDV